MNLVELRGVLSKVMERNALVVKIDEVKDDTLRCR